MVSAYRPAGSDAQRAALGLGRYLLNDTTAQTVTAWIEQLAAGRPVPQFGTAAWLAAPADLRVAACLHAAEAYRRDALFAGQALADALAADEHVEHVRDAEEFRALAKQVQALGAGNHADHAELQRRRAVVMRPHTRQEAA
ncbi:MAG: hypothetical protein JWP11_2930 [Frankiales bacterium]|nr:hypothetical protein [Frankiales bacterium]